MPRAFDAIPQRSTGREGTWPLWCAIGVILVVVGFSLFPGLRGRTQAESLRTTNPTSRLWLGTNRTEDRNAVAKNQIARVSTHLFVACRTESVKCSNDRGAGYRPSLRPCRFRIPYVVGCCHRRPSPRTWLRGR